MRPFTRRALAVGAALATLAAVAVSACGGGSDANHRTCGLVQQVTTELKKRRPDPKVVKSKLGEITREARDAKDRQLHRLAPSLTPPSSTGIDPATGAAPLDFTTAGTLAALDKRCRAAF